MPKTITIMGSDVPLPESGFIQPYDLGRYLDPVTHIYVYGVLNAHGVHLDRPIPVTELENAARTVAEYGYLLAVTEDELEALHELVNTPALAIPDALREKIDTLWIDYTTSKEPE